MNILALDSATEACSVALRLRGELRHRLELAPRRHSQLIFTQLAEVLPAAPLRDAGLDCIAYNHGPGSFTGLRIAASAAQGLAFAAGAPVAGISTLACIAQGAWRQGRLPSGCRALVLLDARIDEIYWGLYGLRDGLAQPLREDAVCRPGDLPLALAADAGEDAPLIALGNGMRYWDALPPALREKLSEGAGEAARGGLSGSGRERPRSERANARKADVLDDVWPDSRDTLALAEPRCRAGELLKAEAAQPVYLRNAAYRQ